MRTGAGLPIGLVDERALPALRPAVRPGRAGILHRGDVRELCPGHPADRAVDLDRILDYALVDVAAAPPPGPVPVHPPDPLDLAILASHLDPLRPVFRPDRRLTRTLADGRP